MFFKQLLIQAIIIQQIFAGCAWAQVAQPQTSLQSEDRLPGWFSDYLKLARQEKQSGGASSELVTAITKAQDMKDPGLQKELEQLNTESSKTAEAIHANKPRLRSLDKAVKKALDLPIGGGMARAIFQNMGSVPQLYEMDSGLTYNTVNQDDEKFSHWIGEALGWYATHPEDMGAVADYIANVSVAFDAKYKEKLSDQTWADQVRDASTIMGYVFTALVFFNVFGGRQGLVKGTKVIGELVSGGAPALVTRLKTMVRGSAAAQKVAEEAFPEVKKSPKELYDKAIALLRKGVTKIYDGLEGANTKLNEVNTFSAGPSHVTSKKFLSALARNVKQEASATQNIAIAIVLGGGYKLFKEANRKFMPTLVNPSAAFAAVQTEMIAALEIDADNLLTEIKENKNITDVQMADYTKRFIGMGVRFNHFKTLRGLAATAHLVTLNNGDEKAKDYINHLKAIAPVFMQPIDNLDIKLNEAIDSKGFEVPAAVNTSLNSAEFNIGAVQRELRALQPQKADATEPLSQEDDLSQSETDSQPTIQMNQK